MSLLAVDRLTVRYRGGAAAALGVALQLDAGRALALVGESGCGKTSTALALMGLLPREARVEGALRLGDGPARRLDEAGLAPLRGRTLAMVFQDAAAALNPVRTVGDQVGEALRLHRGASRAQARQGAIAALGEVGVADPERCAASYPHQLSGGTASRAQLAMALAAGPSVLLADEPTAGLDATVAAGVLALLDRARAARRMALLLLTHDLAIAARHAEELAVMYAGRIVEQGASATVLAAPAHPYTRGLVDAMPLLGEPRPARPIPGEPPDPGTALPGCAFAPRCPLVEPRCRTEAPLLRPLDDGRLVRCHHPLGDAATLGGAPGAAEPASAARAAPWRPQ